MYQTSTAKVPARIRFKVGSNFPSVSQVSDVIGQLPFDRFSPTHLAGGVNGVVPHYASWSLLDFFRAGTIGTAGNSFIIDIEPGGPDAGAFTFDGIVTLTFNHNGNTTFEDFFNAVIALVGASATIFAATGDDAAWQTYWANNIGSGTPASTKLDDFAIDGQWGFAGGVNGMTGTKASLDCFPVGNHHLDTVFEDISHGVGTEGSGNAFTIELTGDAGTGVRVTRSTNAILITYQSGISTVLDVETAVNVFGTLHVKTPGTPDRVLWNNGRHAFMFLDSDFPGVNPGGQLLTAATVGVAFLGSGSDNPITTIFRRQWFKADVQFLNYGDNPQGWLAFDEGPGSRATQFFGSSVSVTSRISDSPNTNGLLRVEVTAQDDSSQHASAVQLINISIAEFLANGPPKMFYTATFDGLDAPGEITPAVRGAIRDPYYLRTIPEAGDRLVFLAEVGRGTGFVGLKNGINGQGNISLVAPNIAFHGGGKAPEAFVDQVILVVQLDPVTGAWLRTYDMGTQFFSGIQSGQYATQIFQNDAGLDTSALSLGVMYQSPLGMTSVIYDGNDQNQSGQFASTISRNGTLRQRGNGSSGKTYIAVFARPS